MSVKVMGMVWDLEIPRDEKFVLLAFADHADHDGLNVYPSYERVALKTGYSERQVKRIVARLKKRGALIVDGKVGRRNKFRIPIGDKMSPIAEGPFDDLQVPSEPPSGTSETPTGDTATAPNPSVKPSTEPSTEPSSPNGTEKNTIRKEFAEDFSQMAGLSIPEPETQAERRTAGKRWWQPIRRMCIEALWDPLVSRRIMAEVLDHMDRDSLTVDAPASIEKNFRATIAAMKRGAYKKAGEPKGNQGLRDYLRTKGAAP